MPVGLRLLPKNPLAPQPSHYKPRVRNVIFCYLSGGLSHIDSFDPKPRLDKEAGEPMPFRTERTMFNLDGNIFPSPWKFRRYGSSGIPVSDLFPHIGSVADELTVIRSMTAKFMAHAQANYYFHCGTPFSGFPSMGAWISYGLGSENRNLPGFVVLGSGGIPLGGINMSATDSCRPSTRDPSSFPDARSLSATSGPGNRTSASDRRCLSSTTWTGNFWRLPAGTPRWRPPSGTTRPPTGCRVRCPSWWI